MTTLIDVIDRAAETYKNKIAFTDIRESFSFEEVRMLGRRIASALLQAGVMFRPVAIYMERSAKIPAAMAGVLLSANFYTVLDTESPPERLSKIAETLETPLILCDGAAEERCKEIFPEKTVLSYEKAVLHTSDAARLAEAAKKLLPGDQAFTIFTSGSTGTPKGTVLTHANVIAYCGWFVERFSIGPDTNFGSQTPFYFSMSVSDLFGAWLSGAAYHIIPKSYFAFPARLVHYINERKIDTIYWVPTALGIVARCDLLSFERFRYMKNVFFAGEVMPVKILNYWRGQLPEARFANLFGPTETTDICAYYVVNRDFEESESLPIGAACEGARLIVVDEDGKEIKEAGRLGELYVAGGFVAKGYYRAPVRTAAAFVQNPLISAYPDTVYRTGDLVAYNDRGELLYFGRKDHQIKHLGYRIELGEIETVMNGVEGVGLCVCLYDEQKDEIVLLYEGTDERKRQIMDEAKKRLTAYMVPAKYICVEGFPVNANGKTDKALLKKRYIG